MTKNVNFNTTKQQQNLKKKSELPFFLLWCWVWERLCRLLEDREGRLGDRGSGETFCDGKSVFVKISGLAFLSISLHPSSFFLSYFLLFFLSFTCLSLSVILSGIVWQCNCASPELCVGLYRSVFWGYDQEGSDCPAWVFGWVGVGAGGGKGCWRGIICRPECTFAHCELQMGHEMGWDPYMGAFRLAEK